MEFSLIRITNKPVVRAAILAAVLILSAALFAGCVTTDPTVSGSEQSPGVQERIPFEDDFGVLLGGESFKPAYRNCEPEEEDVVLYDSSYTKDGLPVLEMNAPAGRTLIGLYPEQTGTKTEFIIFDIKSESEGSLPIPVNGFVLSVPATKLEGLRVRKGQAVKTEGTDPFPKNENMALGSLYPDTEQASVLERRISFMDPELDLRERSADKILYYSENYDGPYTAVRENSYLVSLERVTSRSSRIVSIKKGNSVPKGENVLVFSGPYNTVYVESFLKEGMKVFLNRLENVSGISDSPAVMIDGKVYAFDEANTNPETIDGDGVYLFNGQYASMSTPKSALQHLDVVIMDDVVVYVGEENKPVMIPSNGGVAISFDGEKAEIAKKISVGDTVRTVQLDSTAVSENAIRIGSRIFTFDKQDTDRAPEGISVLYTPAFGTSTKTNMYGLEIIVSNGTVQSVQIGKGDAEIPENGFVLSIHKDATQYAEAGSVETGEAVVTYSASIGYSLTIGNVTRVNGVRNENTLIVYRNVKSTGTNAYGFEVAVDGDGHLVDLGYAGNMSVPSDGYVLSAHGTMVPLLENAYTYGATAIFRDDEMKAYIIRSPETLLTSAGQTVKLYQSRIREAKQKLLYLDYEQLESKVGRMSTLQTEAAAAFKDADYDLAAGKLSEILSISDQMTYSFIESHPAENRAMWYRASEKNDDAVRKTVEKLKALNVNAVYLETWYNGRFAGYSENELILHTTLNRDYDVLEGFVRICHENGIEVHAWVENFFIGTVEAQEAANPKLAEHFKGRWLKDQNGSDTYFYQISNTHFIFMNPFDEEVQKLLVDFYEEIIRKYDIDGIHLDYIRFPETNGKATFGYNEDIIAAWQKEQKTDVNPATLTSEALYNSWVLFRQNIINGFVKRVYQMIQKQDRRVWLSAAVYPGIPDIKRTIFQNCQNWIENGYMDEIFSMSYGADTSYVADNARAFERICKDLCFYSTGLMAFSDSPEQALGQQMTVVRDSGADGVAVFSLANITPSNYYAPVTQGAFRDPSIQVNRLNETVAVQLEYILNKADTLYGPAAGLTDDDIAAVKSLLEPILQEALAFGENASGSAQKAYCTKTIAALEQACETILPLFSSTQRSYAEKDYKELIHWLTISQNRI